MLLDFDELASLTELLDVSGVRPVIDQVLPLEKARDGFAAMPPATCSARSSSPADR